jgi:N-acyl-D-amino-acid deacylase
MQPQRTLIADTTLIDGTGSAGRQADILLRGAVIEAVEPPGRLQGEDWQRIDARGLVVAPGFIDVHSHGDNAPFLDGDDTSKIMQGVTTEVVGNCGFSLAPRRDATADILEDYSRRVFPPVPWSWHSFGDLLSATDEGGYVTNYAPLVGHHSLRIAAIAMQDRAPDADELDLMGGLLEEAIAAGAFGLSTGLIYPPGVFSRTEELAALASRLAPGRIYTSHVRGEGRQLLASLREAVEIGETSGRAVQVSHLKVAGRPNWGLMSAAIEILDAARERGVRVRQDVYPYTAGSTMLTAVLPPWFQEGGNTKVLQRLTDQASLDRLRADLEVDSESWENLSYGAGWEGVVVAASASHRFEGRSIREIADGADGDPVAALATVLLGEELQVSMIVHSMREEDLISALAHPETMIGSDGLPPGLGGKPHPRQYGTFPRILARYVRELKVLSLEDAVRKMTSLPAATFGIADRGTITPGMAADLVAFDADAIADLATYEQSTRPPAGINWVIQNGQVVVREGEYLGPRAGQRLVPGDSTA